jgi:cap1 methyltransferase
MANIDALMGYALSNPKNPDGSSMLGPNELLYFADVNGGPGGNAEYDINID